jgi:hypothetical protein
VEHNQTAFLDLIDKKESNKITFVVYRKPTSTDLIINNSNHLFEQKLAVYHSMLQRMKRFPLTDNNKTKELNTIIHTANNNNGYDTNMILNLKNKIINGNSMTNSLWN